MLSCSKRPWIGVFGGWGLGGGDSPPSLGLSPSLPEAGWLLLMINRKECPRASGSWPCALLPLGSPCPARSQPFNHVWLDPLECYLHGERGGPGETSQPPHHQLAARRLPFSDWPPVCWAASGDSELGSGVKLQPFLEVKSAWGAWGVL